MSAAKHTPAPWTMSVPMGTGHLEGREPWFWVSADRTLHLQVMACPDGYVCGENEANARLIAAAPDLLDALKELADLVDLIRAGDYTPDSFTTQPARAAIAKATAIPIPSQEAS